MGAVRLRVQTADENITIIHMYEIQKPHVYKKSIKMFFFLFFTLNLYFRLKYKSSIYNISPVKRHSCIY